MAKKKSPPKKSAPHRRRRSKAMKIVHLPSHLQGESQNKYGGSRSTYVHPGYMWSQRSKKGLGRVLSNEERKAIEANLRARGLIDTPADDRNSW